MGVTPHSPFLCFSLSFCPLLRIDPSPTGHTQKVRSLRASLCVLPAHQNDPFWSHICRHSIIITATATPLFPASLWPFLLWPQAPTQVNGRVSNIVGLFKLPASLLTSVQGTGSCAQYTLSLFPLMQVCFVLYWVFFNQLDWACSLQSVSRTVWYWVMLERLFYREIKGYHLIHFEFCTTQAAAWSPYRWCLSGNLRCKDT